ncbi:MAG: DNA/RNA non-specific endonuclease [Gemmatimonadaceae bacterium]|nr:DNA/RNA non-specific endonuclease [Gemmatimonadaceae bacterium]
MRLRTGLAFVTLAFAVTSCSENSVTGPSAPDSPRFVAAAAIPLVRISEFHYDNVSTDTGEAIEISGPAGTNLAGWTLLLYNGSPTQRNVYGTFNLTGLIPATCGSRGVVVTATPGIQNGDPDGIALIDPLGAVVEFLSYGGSFTAINGSAAGVTSTDILQKESGTTTPIGHSLQRTSAGTWSAPAVNTFGACNDFTDPPPPAVVDRVTVTPEAATIEAGASQSFTGIAYDAANAPVTATLTWSSTVPEVASVNASGLATGLNPGNTLIIAVSENGKADTATLQVNAPPPPPETRFSEIHYDNFGTDVNEAIEIEGPAGTVLTGWTVVLYNGNGGASYDTKPLLGNIPLMCDGRGVVSVSYPSNGIQNGNPDGFALVKADGVVVEFLSYGGAFAATDGPASGLSSRDIGVVETGAPVGQSLQRNAFGTWLPPATATIGACNSGVGPPPPPPGNSISFSGRTPSEVPLPVGFEDQIFATLRGPTGATIVTTFTWSSETPALASIDADGVMRALAAGTAIVRATAADGTTATYSLPTRIAVASTTAQYGSNTEFGEPTDSDPSNDFIIRRDQFTSSWNDALGTPNWVSYNLDLTHFGAEDRCDCFTYDPLAPGAVYTTADYTGAGAVAGYGIDRGHLARSFDREAGSLDNATTYYFSNIIPQAADLNQGPWAVMENYLGNLAQNQNREVYIIAGVFGSKGTVRNEGRITIPDSVWKVAVIMPRDQGIENIDDYQDLEVVAVIMPNDAGVRNIAWETYKRTVDDVEGLTGYDLLALLRDDIEIAVESGTVPPVAALDGPYTSIEGETVPMSAALSSDADGDVLTYAWTFGDGGTATGVSVSRTYTAAGVYTVRLIATDVRGLADTVFTTATVISRSQAVEDAITLVDQLVGAGTISNGSGNSLSAKLSAAQGSLERGNTDAASGQLGAVLDEIDAMVRSGRLTPADAAALRGLVARVIASMG